MNKSIETIVKENEHPIRMFDNRRNLKKLFVTAFFQVFLVSANTFFISRVAWLGIAACGFGISYLWTLNVKRISAGSMLERVVYASGAMAGGLLGVLTSKLILA